VGLGRKGFDAGLHRVTHSLLRAGPDTLAQSAYSPDRVRGSPLEPPRRQSLGLALDSKVPLTCRNVDIPTIPIIRTTHTNGIQARSPVSIRVTLDRDQCRGRVTSIAQ
jgi:hypothetical protein